MEEDKAFILRKILTVVSLILIFATAGLLAITTQLKTITFNYYGNVKTIKTLASSVDAFLLQNNISLNDTAVIEPAKKSRVINGMTISIYTEEEKAFDIESFRESYSPIIASVKEEIHAIPFEEETVDNNERDSGETEVIQEGVEGSKSVSYIVKSTKDKVIQKEEVGTEVIAQVQNRIVEVGTKVTLASRSGVISSITATPVGAGFVSYNVALPVEQQQYAYKLCEKYGIDYPLFLSIMYHESRYVPTANNNNTYIGLCQVWNAHLNNLGPTLGITDLYDPYDNMTAGAYLLSYYINNNGGVEAGLASYGGGYSYVPDVMKLRDTLIANGGL